MAVQCRHWLKRHGLEAVLLALLLAGSLCSSACSAGCTYRLLAVGDSITEGWVASTNVKHPYTLVLQQLLQQELPCCDVVIDNAAIGGAGIIAVGNWNRTTLGPHVTSVLEEASANEKNYDLVVVSGGICDLLGLNKPADDIAPGFYQLYQAALSTGAKVLILPPFPSLLVPKDGPKEYNREKLAQLQKAYANGKPNLQVLDLSESPLNFYSMSSTQVQQLLDDKLHLTVAGYDLVGQSIFDFLSNNTTSYLPSCDGK